MTDSPRLAAQYVRMSTDHQRYSPEYQMATNGAYALSNRLEIVRTYLDAGVSGLTLSKREGLKALLLDVLGGDADYAVVLVYDVSRWGRFQDPDQAAHLEFICREAGVEILYTAEPFANDSSLIGALAKQVKRAMAAEFSRELSAKIITSKRGLGLQGYWPGGNPGLGLRRGAQAGGGLPALRFEPGERNAIKGRRLIVVPGPTEEIALVRRIFHLFTVAATTPNAVARRLNAENRPAPGGRQWTQIAVRRVLTNELYVGTRIVGRAEVRLGRVTRRPEAEWTRVTGAAEPIISIALFDAAQRRLVRRQFLTDAQMLERLRALLARTGRLSHRVVATDKTTPSPQAYRHHFGSLSAAFALVGYEPSDQQKRLTSQLAPFRPGGLAPRACPLSDKEIIARLMALRQQAGVLTLGLIEVTPGLPRARSLIRRFGSMENVYRLAGHEPSARQRQGMGRRRRAAPAARSSMAPSEEESAKRQSQQQWDDQHTPPSSAGLEPTAHTDTDRSG